MKDEMEWHSGPPPHIGWWNASAILDPTIWRWWNGKHWGLAATDKCSRKEVARCAARAGFVPMSAIRWRHYYPENARVPRINPEAA